MIQLPKLADAPVAPPAGKAGLYIDDTDTLRVISSAGAVVVAGLPGANGTNGTDGSDASSADRLAKASNLSDLTNVPSALDNLLGALPTTDPQDGTYFLNSGVLTKSVVSLLFAWNVMDISGWTVTGGSTAFHLVGSDVYLGNPAEATSLHVEGTDSVVFDFTGCVNVTIFTGRWSLTALDLSPLVAMTALADNALTECTSLTSLTLPAGLTSIGVSALALCTGLTSLTLPSGLTTIGDYALYGCDGLTSLTLPDGLTTIGDYALFYCDGLTSLTLPSGLTSIGYSALAYCYGLTYLSCLALAAPTLGGAFTAIAATEIHVPTAATGYGSTYGGLTVIADL